eukprot:tig00000144_g9091.t1
MVLTRLAAGAAGLVVGGPVGAFVGAFSVHLTDEIISAERARGNIVAAKSLLDVRAQEPVKRVALWSAPLILSASRLVNPLVDMVNALALGPARLLGVDAEMPRPEHHFITLETHAGTFYVLQKCHNGDIRFIRRDSLEACKEEGIRWGGTDAGLESAFLEEEVVVDEARALPLVAVSDWVHKQEPVYVLKWANCQHFAGGLMKWLRRATGQQGHGHGQHGAQHWVPSLSPIPSAGPTPCASPAPPRLLPVDAAPPLCLHDGLLSDGGSCCGGAASPAAPCSPVPPPSPLPAIEVPPLERLGRARSASSGAASTASSPGSSPTAAERRALSCSPIERLDGSVVCSPAF